MRHHKCDKTGLDFAVSFVQTSHNKDQKLVKLELS